MQFLPIECGGIYRDDGIWAIKGGPQHMERAKKKLFKLFKEEGLKITVEGGAQAVDFLDVVLDLSNGSYCPYVKPNTATKYVSTQSNHPKKIIEMIPHGVSKRLSTNSSSAEEFNQHSTHFKDALKSAGYEDELVYEEIQEEEGRDKKRRRNVIFFNPPWSMNVKTNIGKKFLSLVRKHFPKGSPLYSIFNEKKLKMSYSTMPNMAQHIAGHNKKVIKMAEGREDPQSFGCNCRTGVQSCPLNGECKTPHLVYKAEVKAGDETKFYIGQTANTFKKRYNGHKSDVKLRKRKTTLSTHMVELERRGVVPEKVVWSKVAIVKPKQKGDMCCQLCLSEKTHIAVGGDGILNKRWEIMARCRHKEKLVLLNDLCVVTEEGTDESSEEEEENSDVEFLEENNINEGEDSLEEVYNEEEYRLEEEERQEVTRQEEDRQENDRLEEENIPEEDEGGGGGRDSVEEDSHHRTRRIRMDYSIFF